VVLASKVSSVHFLSIIKVVDQTIRSTALGSIYNSVIREYERNYNVNLSANSKPEAESHSKSCIDIAKDLIKTLLHNGSVNIFQHTRHATILWKYFICGPHPENNMSVVFSAWSVPRLYNGSVFAAQVGENPCGGGVEYLHRDPASRRRRRKGKSQI
jgi:hypothetical protein